MPPLSEWSPLLTFLGVAVAAALGGGGISALLKVRHDKRLGVATQEVAEDDAEAARWMQIIKTQTEAIVQPMQGRISALEGNISTLEEKIERLETNLETTRRKYWMAISYIRNLLTWIHRHMPDDLEITAVPNPQAELVEDI